jgi:hypothetical protein
MSVLCTCFGRCETEKAAASDLNTLKKPIDESSALPPATEASKVIETNICPRF